MPATPAQPHTVEFAEEARRGITAGRRARIEALLSRADHLAPEDAFLIRQVYEHGLRIDDIARQANVPRPRIYRRVRSLLSRMDLPLYCFVVSHAAVLDALTRKVARLVICQGLAQRDAAARLHLSLHQVRQCLSRVRALARI